MAQYQTYNPRNKCWVLIEAGRVVDNRKEPFENVEFCGPEDAKHYADHHGIKFADESQNYTFEIEPENSPEDGAATDDVEATPEPAKADDGNDWAWYD